MRLLVGIGFGSFCAGVGLVVFVTLLVRSGSDEEPVTRTHDTLAWAGRTPVGQPELDVSPGADGAGKEPLVLADTPTEAGDVEVELTGTNYRWQIHYPGSPHWHSGPAGDIHVPSESGVRLRLRSRDYVYMLDLPQLKQRQIAVPGQVYTLAFRTTGPGSFVIEGDRLCGPAHPSLTLKVVVEPQPAFRAWLASGQEGKDQ